MNDSGEFPKVAKASNNCSKTAPVEPLLELELEIG